MSNGDTQTTPPAGPREVWAWAFFDFANSGYTTVVLTTIYSAFFVAVIAADWEQQSPGSATLLWTLAIACSNFLVLISAPVIGAIADYRAWKKPFLIITTVTCVLATAGLALAGPGDVGTAAALIIVSCIAFASGENLIAAFLPEIAPSGKMGRISGYGWSLGYCGGLLVLGTCLAYITWAQGQGQTPGDYVPMTLIFTAIIFALAATPTFLWLRERALPSPLPGTTSYLRAGFGEVARTLRHAAELPDLFRFLVCLTCYQAGVATVVVIAAIYAQEVFHFSSQQLIALIMVVNLTAALGALVFGFAQDRYGSVPCLAASLLLWIVAGIIALLASSESQLWLAGNLMGLAMGASQAGGRALVGEFTPVKRCGEFFGLWGLAARTAAIIGPVVYGLIGKLTGGDHRLAMLSTLMFFVLGLILLTRVDEQRGIAAGKAF